MVRVAAIQDPLGCLYRVAFRIAAQELKRMNSHASMTDRSDVDRKASLRS
jgi:hypothetical protein